MDADRPLHRRLSRRDALRLGTLTTAAVALGGCCRRLEPRAGEAEPPVLPRPEPRIPRPRLLTPPNSEPLVRVRVGSRPATETIFVGVAGEPLWVRVTDEPDDSPGDRPNDPLVGPLNLRRRGAGWIWEDAAGRRGTAGDTEAAWPPPPAAPSEAPEAPEAPAVEPDPVDPAADGPETDTAGAIPPAPPPLTIGRRSDVDAAAPEPAGGITWNGSVWPGRLRLVAGRDLVHVVAVVPMETYIPGVLARELFAGWRAATFEAQAIAARSFATFQVLDRRDRPWHLESDQRSQVFGGRTTLTAAVDAGRATAGLILTYAGGVLPAYYSSTCGGVGMPARLAIGPAAINAVPPLEGHGLDCCRSAPRYRWTATRTLERVREQIRGVGAAEGDAALASIGRLRSITVAGRTDGGRPTRYRIEHGITDGGGAEAIGTVEIDAERLRRMLRSRRLPGEDPVHSGFLEPTVDAARGIVHFVGRGFGHGAGLCQYGAEALAERGLPAGLIVAAYYPGADLTRAWPAGVA